MPRKPQDEWITSKKAAEILTANSGHTVTPTYVRLLAKSGKIDTKEIDERTKLYNKSDVDAYTVAKRGTGEIRRAARAPRGKKKEETAA